MDNKITFDIQGMTCTSCSGRIEKALNEMDNIVEASINFPAKKGRATLKDGTDPGIIISKIESLGYNASFPNRQTAGTNKYSVEGMTCTACAARVEKVLLKTPGVKIGRAHV